MSQTLYCTPTDLVNRLSVEGVAYRVDDLPPQALGDCISEASIDIDAYLLSLYDAAQLAQSTWVKHRCANLAACHLCSRRGNPTPPGIAQKCKDTKKDLEKVAAGKLQVPDVSPRAADVPVLSSMRAKLSPFPRTVVEPSRSTGKPEGYTQFTDRQDSYMDYVI